MSIGHRFAVIVAPLILGCPSPRGTGEAAVSGPTPGPPPAPSPSASTSAAPLAPSALPEALAQDGGSDLAKMACSRGALGTGPHTDADGHRVYVRRGLALETVERLLRPKLADALACDAQGRAGGGGASCLVVSFEVDGKGRAASVELPFEEANGPLLACVRTAVAAIEFPPTEGGVRVTWKIDRPPAGTR